jgi:hypothetical protein
LKDVLFDIIEKEEEGKFISLLRNRDHSLGLKKLRRGILSGLFLRGIQEMRSPKRGCKACRPDTMMNFVGMAMTQSKEFNPSCAQTGSGKGDEVPPGKSG